MRGCPSARADQLERALFDARLEAQSDIARECDAIHTVERARGVGSIDTIVEPGRLRAHVIEMREQTKP